MTAERVAAALAQIEAIKGVRVVYAVESGSRAWGFPSRDSDYDVRFLYVRPIADYLAIDEPRDVIEQPITDDLDVNGWDLRKALQLFRKSNPPLIEWLHSPIIYTERYATAQRLRDLQSQYHNPRASVYHYLHMARGQFRQYLQGDEVRTKKYFYALRPILACLWLERYETIPPVQFEELLEAVLPADSAVVVAIRDLLARKLAGDEFDVAPPIAVLQEFLSGADRALRGSGTRHHPE